MMTDPIADMLTRVRNALAADLKAVEMPMSREKEGIATVLKREGFIEGYQQVGQPPKTALRIQLKYGALGERAISTLDRVSKPGRRIYRGVSDLPRVANGLGILIVSTGRGMLSDRECRKLNVGGEVLCSVL